MFFFSDRVDAASRDLHRAADPRLGPAGLHLPPQGDSAPPGPQAGKVSPGATRAGVPSPGSVEEAEPSPAAPTAAGAAGAPEPGHTARACSARRSLRRPTWPRARSPRIRWLPHPTAPAPVLRGRRGSGSSFSLGSGLGRRAAARPPPGTGRPAPPADPPRGRGPHRPTTGQRGRSQPRTRHDQSSQCRTPARALGDRLVIGQGC